MARGKKTGGRDWKPGQSGNPEGRKPMSPEEKEFRQFRSEKRADVSRRSWDLLQLTQREAAELLAPDSKLNLWEKGVLACAAEVCNRGDAKRLQILLEIVLGPHKQEMELSGAGGEALPLVDNVTLTGKDLTHCIDELKGMIKKKGAGRGRRKK